MSFQNLRIELTHIPYFILGQLSVLKWMLIFFFTLNVVSGFAQTQVDSLSKSKSDLILEKFPRQRILNIEYDHSMNRSLESKLLGQHFGSGVVKSQKNFSSNINMLLHKRPNWILLASSIYRFTEFDFENVLSKSPTIFENNGVVNAHYFSTGLNSVVFSTLLKRDVIYNSSLFIDGDNYGVKRMKGVFGLSLLLKRSKQKSIGIGFQAFLDLTVTLPIIPTFIYNHKFHNSKWQIDAVLPKQLLFRTDIGKYGRLSVGSSLGSSVFYMDLSSTSFSNVFSYNQLEIKSGLVYEHRINNYLIATFKGGIQSFVNNRLTQKDKFAADYIYKNTQSSTGYFNIGLSIAPLAKKERR